MSPLYNSAIEVEAGTQRDRDVYYFFTYRRIIMSYTKKTFIFEKRKAAFTPSRSFTMAGHASTAGITSKALKCGFRFPIEVVHRVFDDSGKGRGGEVARFVVNSSITLGK
jgi:hypothetical protein